MIILKALEFIRLNVDSYINSLLESATHIDAVKLGNASLLADPQTANNNPNECIYLSLVNIQEEATFKNNPPVRISETGTNFKKSPIYLNLFVLASSFFKDYNKSLEYLSYVIQYFHNTKTFTFSTSAVSETVDTNSIVYTFTDNDKNNLQLTFDLVSLTFEQLNYLWGTLGGRQLPFVLYKVRLLEIESTLQKKGGGFIQEIKTVHPKV